MDISTPSKSTLKQFSSEELTAFMREAMQAAEDAKQGDEKAIDKLLSLVWTLVQRQRAFQIKKKITGRASWRRKAEKAGKPSPDETAIMQQAVDELVDSGLDWEDMVAVMKEEIKEYPDVYTVSEESTLLKILESNRTTIKMIARGIHSPTP